MSEYLYGEAKGHDAVLKRARFGSLAITRMKSLAYFSQLWRSQTRSQDFGGAELISYKLGESELMQDFPKGPEQRQWYGIYFISKPGVKSSSSGDEQKPSVTLLNSNFNVVLDRKENCQNGFFLLLHRNSLPKKLNYEIEKVSLFAHRNAGPFVLKADQVLELDNLLNKISDEITSNYHYKNELIVVLLMQLVHFMVKNFSAL